MCGSVLGKRFVGGRRVEPWHAPLERGQRYQSLLTKFFSGDSGCRRNVSVTLQSILFGNVVMRMRTSGKSLGRVVQSLAVSEATYNRWRQQYGGMKAEEAIPLKEPQVETARLKKLLAEAELDKAMLKEIAEGNF